MNLNQIPKDPEIPDEIRQFAAVHVAKVKVDGIALLQKISSLRIGEQESWADSSFATYENEYHAFAEKWSAVMEKLALPCRLFPSLTTEKEVYDKMFELYSNDRVRTYLQRTTDDLLWIGRAVSDGFGRQCNQRDFKRSMRISDRSLTVSIIAAIAAGVAVIVSLINLLV